MDVDINEHERLSTFTQIKVKEKRFYFCPIYA